MAIRDLDVYGVGNALVDLQVRVDDEFLKRLDVPKGQMLLVDDRRQAEVLASLEGHPIHRSSGGSAANTIAGVAELGGRAGFCGRVAPDPLGKFYVLDMERVGVAVDSRRDGGQTGTSLVMITPDAQRTMMTNLGISSALAPADLDTEALSSARYLYVEGYLFTGESTRQAALEAIVRAKAAGRKVALTVSDPFVINACRDLLWQLIEGPVDLLFCNEQEAKALTQRDDPLACAEEIHRHAENVALTLGANGSILMHEGKVFPIEGVKVEAIDTTGAGDMYAAGILYGIGRGMSWSQAGRLASQMAARVVAQLGARLPGKLTPTEIAALAGDRH